MIAAAAAAKWAVRLRFWRLSNSGSGMLIRKRATVKAVAAADKAASRQRRLRRGDRYPPTGHRCRAAGARHSVRPPQRGRTQCRLRRASGNRRCVTWAAARKR